MREILRKKNSATFCGSRMWDTSGERGIKILKAIHLGDFFVNALQLQIKDKKSYSCCSEHPVFKTWRVASGTGEAMKCEPGGPVSVIYPSLEDYQAAKQYTRVYNTMRQDLSPYQTSVTTITK